MRREPIFKSALTVVFFWVAVWYALHPEQIKNLLHVGSVASLTTFSALGGMMALGVVMAFWLSSDHVDDRIRAIEPVPENGVVPSIGKVPIHAKALPFFKDGYDADNPRASLQAAFKILRESQTLIPASLRRLPVPKENPGEEDPQDAHNLDQQNVVNLDGIDLDALESSVLATDDRYVAIYDKVLRILMHKPDLLTTYERNGHGRKDGVGGRTLLQHSLLVSLKCLDLAPKTGFNGIHGRERVERTMDDGTVVVYYKETEEIIFGTRNRVIENFGKDPLVPIIGLAHDIGKIECYQWAPGAREPYALRPNHDLVGAHILARMPELWKLPKTPAGQIEEDERDILISAIAFYHHPSEQPMDSGRSVKASDRPVVVRSDRMVGLMELLIKADRMSGAIENGADDKAAKEAAVMEPVEDGGQGILRKADEKALIWESIESILNEPDRINAKLVMGRHPDRSVGFLVEVPDWHKNPLLILIESAFTAAVIQRADIPDARKDALLKVASANHNAATEGTRLILEIMGERGMLVTPPGQAQHSHATSIWQIFYYKPDQVYARGDIHAERLPNPLGEAQFRAGDSIICDPSGAFPIVAAKDRFDLVPVCERNRFGGAGLSNGKKKGKSDQDKLSRLEAGAQAIDAGAAMPPEQSAKPAKKRPPVASAINKPEPGSEADVFISTLKSYLRNGEIQASKEPQDGWFRLSEQFERILEKMSMRAHADAIERSVQTKSDIGIALVQCDDEQGNPCHIVLADERWVEDTPLDTKTTQGPKTQGPKTPHVVDEKPKTAENAGQHKTDEAESIDIQAQEPDTKESVEDHNLRFQVALAKYLQEGGRTKLKPRTFANRTYCGLLQDFNEVLHALRIEEAMLEISNKVPDKESGPVDFFTASMNKDDRKVPILVISSDWLDRRGIEPPSEEATQAPTTST